MKRAILLLTVVLCSGCSTLGGLEVLNDMGPTGRSVGTISRTIDSSCKVLTGHSCDQMKLNTAQINRTIGNAKQLPYVMGTGNIPYILQETQDLTR